MIVFLIVAATLLYLTLGVFFVKWWVLLDHDWWYPFGRFDSTAATFVVPTWVMWLPLFVTVRFLQGQPLIPKGNDT